jgi:hypothetical protein
MTETQQTFAIIGINLGLSLLLPFICTLFTKTEKKYLIAVFTVFSLVTIGILFIPSLPVFDKLNWNWQGKFLSFLVAIAFLYFTPFLTKEQAGFTFKINKSVWIPFILLTAISLAFNMYTSDIKGGDKTKEYLLFQLTMPGLSEEPIYRGILLGLLNLVFVARRNILGASMGIGAIIQCALFGLGHAIYFDDKQHIQFYLEGFTITFTLGAFMTYLKEKGESIIPALLFHNLFNSCPAILRLFV